MPEVTRAPAVEENVFFGNSALEGGAIRFCFFYGGLPEPTVRWNAVFDNDALTKGGGVSVWDADPVIENCTFDGNGAGEIGGGVYVGGDETPPKECTLLTSIVSNSTNGGGVACGSALLTTSRCDVWGNVGGDYINCEPGVQDMSLDPLFCDPVNRNLTLRDDSPCLPAGNPWGVLIGAYGAGDCGTSVEGEHAGGTFRLEPPFPNPSRGPVGLGYAIDVPGAPVELVILTVGGRVVRKFRDVPERAGAHRLTWDGVDGAGHPVASGVYVVRGTAGAQTDYRGVVILRR